MGIETKNLITINNDMLKRASTLGLQDKYKLALIGAGFVVNDDEGIATANSYYKQLFLYRVLAADLLHIIDLEYNDIISVDEYDNLIASNIIGQLREYQSEYKSDIGNLILSEFKIFKEMLDMEIKNEIAKRNDIVTRLDKSIQINATPELFQAIAENKDEIIKHINETTDETNK